MKIYNENGILQMVICNCCGKKMLPVHGILKEDSVSLVKKWGYFSNKDGEIHECDLCESCYDKMTKQFCYPVTVTEQIEII